MRGVIKETIKSTDAYYCRATGMRKRFRDYASCIKNGFHGTMLILYIPCLVKQLEPVLSGMKNYACLKQYTLDC